MYPILGLHLLPLHQGASQWSSLLRMILLWVSGIIVTLQQITFLVMVRGLARYSPSLPSFSHGSLYPMTSLISVVVG
jgi:hypothetical protein